MIKTAFDFLPRGFSSLIDYISPSAFEVIEWTSALKKSAKVSKELIFGTSLKRLKEQFRHHLPAGVEFQDGNTGFATAARSTEAAQVLGQKILEVYFLQIFKGEEVFIDLRKDRFFINTEGIVTWQPNGLWYKFSTQFIAGLRDVYTGFYGNNESSLRAGLLQLGLFSESMTPEATAELRGLLEAHFGYGRTAPMKFSVAHFMSSFDSLFLLLKKHKLKLSEDFLFLGIYLLTLYLHLDSLNTPLDVNHAYQLATAKTADRA